MRPSVGKSDRYNRAPSVGKSDKHIRAPSVDRNKNYLVDGPDADRAGPHADGGDVRLARAVGARVRSVHDSDRRHPFAQLTSLARHLFAPPLAD